MEERSLARLDVLSRVLLWIWVALVLVALIGGRLGSLQRLLDYSAWVAFGGAFLLSFLSRWLNEIVDKEAIGPLRIWMAAALAALIMCFSSTFIIGPKVQERLASARTVGQAASQDQAPLRKAQSVARQMLVLRVLLGLGLGWGVRKLPRKKAE